MELLIIGCIALFTSIGVSTLMNKKKDREQFITQEQGQQLTQRIKATEQEQTKIYKGLKKSNERLIERVHEFEILDKKRYQKLRNIQDLIISIDDRLKEKGKYKITEEQALKQLNNLDDDFSELEEVEEEIDKLKHNNKYRMQI
jgi:hypothetical protein